MLFDTVVFNRILDGVMPMSSLAGEVEAFVTHIQRDEIAKTTDEKRKAALMDIFDRVVHSSSPTASFVLGVSRLGEARLAGERIVPTSSAVFGVSRYGHAKYSASDNLYMPIKLRLDELNKSKENNAQDALIAETAIKDGYLLVTDDRDLHCAATEFGGRCLSVAELMTRLKSHNARLEDAQRRD